MTYIDVEGLIRNEAVQLREETGSDKGLLDAIECVCAEIPQKGLARDAALEQLYGSFDSLIAEVDAAEPREPNALEAIQALTTPVGLPLAPNGPQMLDKMIGAWSGRIAGCMLGKPVEGLRKSEIDAVLSTCGESEIEDYLAVPPVSSPHRARFDDPVMRRCTRRLLTTGVSDDDINYTVLGLRILEERGRRFTPEDVVNAWLAYMPAGQCFTAERVAYRNLLNGILPPQSALYRNSYREWIGAQIRADAWGYANPGNVRTASTMAWRDASISHRKNGIYGEMWAAACVAAGFVLDDPAAVIRAGLSVIPPESRLTKAIRLVLDVHKNEPSDWRKGWKTINAEYGVLNGVHTINNACFVALGLLYGNRDFGRTIGIAVHAGQDADCNGATAGSIVGAMLGSSALPKKWIAPLNGTVETTLATMTTEKISDLAERTLRVL